MIWRGNRISRVLLIRSSLRIFSAGADLKLMRDCFATEDGPGRMIETVRRMQRLFDRIEALPQVVVAEIGGAAHGGGFELALACDLRVAAESARLGLPEARLGLLPGAGGTQRLSRLAGPGVARRLILMAEVDQRRAGPGSRAGAMGGTRRSIGRFRQQRCRPDRCVVSGGAGRLQALLQRGRCSNRLRHADRTAGDPQTVQHRRYPQQGQGISRQVRVPT